VCVCVINGGLRSIKSNKVFICEVFSAA